MAGYLHYQTRELGILGTVLSWVKMGKNQKRFSLQDKIVEFGKKIQRRKNRDVSDVFYNSATSFSKGQQLY